MPRLAEIGQPLVKLDQAWPMQGKLLSMLTTNEKT